MQNISIALINTKFSTCSKTFINSKSPILHNSDTFNKNKIENKKTEREIR